MIGDRWWKRLRMVMGLVFLAWPLLSAEIKPAADAPQPVSPEESLKRFKLAPGFRIELVASEPMLADPVGMAFDERGRLFVCEIYGYNREGHYDIQELNKTGGCGIGGRRRGRRGKWTVPRIASPGNCCNWTGPMPNRANLRQRRG